MNVKLYFERPTLARTIIDYLRYTGYAIPNNFEIPLIKSFYEALLSDEKLSIDDLCDEISNYIENHDAKLRKSLEILLFDLYRHLSSLPIKPLKIVSCEGDMICLAGCVRGLLSYQLGGTMILEKH